MVFEKNLRRNLKDLFLKNSIKVIKDLKKKPQNLLKLFPNLLCQI